MIVLPFRGQKAFFWGAFMTTATLTGYAFKEDNNGDTIGPVVGFGQNVVSPIIRPFPIRTFLFFYTFDETIR